MKNRMKIDLHTVLTYLPEGFGLLSLEIMLLVLFGIRTPPLGRV